MKGGCSGADEADVPSTRSCLAAEPIRAGHPTRIYLRKSDVVLDGRGKGRRWHSDETGLLVGAHEGEKEGSGRSHPPQQEGVVDA